MDSDFQHQNYQHHFQDQRQFPHEKQQMNSLTRFRSAPSAYFASFLDAIDNTIPNSNEAVDAGNSGQRSDFSNVRPLSPETENIFARFMSSMAGDSNNNNNNDSSSQKLCDIPENSMMEQTQFAVGPVKQETETLHQPQQQHQQQQQQMIYQCQSKPPLARQSNSVSSVSSATVMENSFQGGSSMGMDYSLPRMKIGGGNGNHFNNNGSSTGLTRHSSSPAGFFSNIMNMDNGFGVMKGMGNFGGGDGQINFSSAPSTTSGLMNPNSDMGAKRFRSSGNNSSNNESNYMTGNPMTSWDDSILSENFSNLERSGGDDGRKTVSELNSSENQGQEGRNRPPLLSHHLSLPKTSAEMSAMEKLLQFQDTVPCRIRAKRGCATHPRSIAERVRRTRISERMRKLQDLVPNMEKQTNTSDMLDLAVEYIKDLQNQVKTLTDNRAKCTCCS